MHCLMECAKGLLECAKGWQEDPEGEDVVKHNKPTYCF
jgi:hypothetical protein